jgi:hypothetical protein
MTLGISMIPTSSRRQSASTLTENIAVMQKLKNHALNTGLSPYRREIMQGNCETEQTRDTDRIELLKIALFCAQEMKTVIEELVEKAVFPEKEMYYELDRKASSIYVRIFRLAKKYNIVPNNLGIESKIK